VKKLNVILLILSFILSGIGSIFLFDVKNTTNDSIQTTEPIKDIVTEEIVYTEKSYEDYFVDYNISKDTITEDDLSGSGTETNPYLIKSLKGFLYIINNDKSKISLSNKYLRLTCDIILNDETFDENGNPSGGDGTYYNFEYYAQTIYSFDGDGFSVKGLYSKDSTNTKDVSLFHKLEYLQNINMENYYLEGKNAEGLSCSTVTNVLNCSVSGGYMYGSSAVEGIVYIAYNMENCISNSTLYGGARGTGLARILKKSAKNCKNYSNITVNEVQAAGLFHTIDTTKGIEVVLENCVNYGTVIGLDTDYTAGIVGDSMYNMWVTMKNCANYGEVNGKSYTASIIALARGTITIYNCTSQAVIKGQTKAKVGEFVAMPFVNAIVIIDRGIVKSSNNLALIEMPYKTSISNYISISILNTQINLKKTESQKQSSIFIGTAGDVDDLLIRNCVINIKEDAKYNMSLFENSINPSKYTPIKNITVSNVLLVAKNIQKNVLISNNIHKDDNYLVDGIVYQLKDKNVYYGSDFSGYFFSWRTGEIGLIAFEGRGSFQGKIDEEWLKNKGYEKKSV